MSRPASSGREGAEHVYPTRWPDVDHDPLGIAGHRHNGGMNAKELDSCDGCGYDAAEWTDRDSINTIAVHDAWHRLIDIASIA